MSEEQTSIPAKADPLATIAAPFAIFSVALFLMLLFSLLFILPRFTTVSIDGIALSAGELAAYQNTLTASVTELETKRSALVLPTIDATYDALRDAKRAAPSLPEITSRLRSLASTLAPSDLTVVHLARTKLDVATRSMTIEGQVENVGERSMSILASFIDLLQSQDWITDLTPPTLTRIDAADGSYVSPFTITFTLR